MATPSPRAIPSPLKFHGGKAYLASKIVALMPHTYTHYVEPYFGSGVVMLANNPVDISEVANDINGELINFWRVLRDNKQWLNFVALANNTAFDEAAYNKALIVLSTPYSFEFMSWARAYAFFVVCRQSMAGRMKSFAPLSRTRTRGGMNEQASAWLGAVEGLPEVHARLKRVAILNRPALEVIQQQDGPQTLYYLDPPYLHETRATTTEYGANEMSIEDHRQLLTSIQHVKGKIMLSGYQSPLYQAFLKGWTLHTFDLPNNAASGPTKRRMTECLWCNY